MAKSDFPSPRKSITILAWPNSAVIVELATFYQFDADAMTSSRISVDL